MLDKFQTDFDHLDMVISLKLAYIFCYYVIIFGFY
jgi:hypothetical protein